MAIYRIQRIYSEENNGQQQKKSGMSTLGKVALGTAAIGGGLAAAKFGMLGGAAQRTTNNWLMKAGKTVGSQRMMNSGAKGLAEGQYKGLVSGLKGVSDVNQGASNMLTNLTNNKTSIVDQLTHSNLAQVAFSEDTNKSLREAAIIASGLALTTGGVLAAKHGLLGKSAKEGYNKVSSKIKNLWSGKKPVVDSKEADAALNTIKGAAKKIYSDSDKKKILAKMKEMGLDTHNPSLFEEVAKKLGCTPIN